MDDLVVIVLIVFAMVNAIRSSKKKKQKGQAAGQISSAKKSRAAAQKGREADFFAAFAGSQQSGGGGAQTRSAQPRVTQPRAAADERLHGPGVHLHDVTQEQMNLAQEGEDPCHAGSAPAAMPEEAAPANPLREAMADDLLRGVVMSEILTRPCQRQTAIGRRTKA